jgi:hypothetical protein
MKHRPLAFALLADALLLGPVSARAESDLVKYCSADIERLCKGIPAGDSRLMDCLKAHEKEMSVGCAQALKNLKS